MRVVYNLDKQSVAQAISTQSHVVTFSDQYRGFKLFEIFQNRYLDQLTEFCYQKNKTLYAMLVALKSSSEDFDQLDHY